MACIQSPEGLVCEIMNCKGAHGKFVNGGWVYWFDPEPQGAELGKSGKYTSGDLIGIADKVEEPFNQNDPAPLSIEVIDVLTQRLKELAIEFGESAVITVMMAIWGGPVPSNTSRKDDRCTAVEAGKRHQESDIGRFGKRSKKYTLLSFLQAKWPRGFTAQEAAVEVERDDALSVLEGTRRRMSDLSAKGVEYIEKIGERENPHSGTPSDVWAISDAGLVALRNIELTDWSRDRKPQEGNGNGSR